MDLMSLLFLKNKNHPKAYYLDDHPDYKILNSSHQAVSKLTGSTY